MIYLMPNFHFDLTWHKNTDTFFRISSEIFLEALDYMDADTRYHYSIDHVAFINRHLQTNPDQVGRVKKFVQNGQLSLVGGMVSMMDCDIPDGEAFVRQLLYGQRWFEKTFGLKARVGWLIDNYGYAPQIPQLLHLAGIEYLEICLWWTPTGFLEGQIGCSEFRWQGLDNSQILVHVAIPNYTGPIFPGSHVYDQPPEVLEAGQEWGLALKSIQDWREKAGSKASGDDLLGHIGGDFRHSSPRLVEYIRFWNDQPENDGSEAVLTGPEPFFEKLNERKETLKVYQGEINPLMRTVVKTQADILAIGSSPFHVRPIHLGRFGEGYGETKVERKQLDRAFHFAARQAEQAIAWQWLAVGKSTDPITGDSSIQTRLTDLYQPVLVFGHHDPFIGCCVIDDYDHQIALLRQSISLAEELCSQAYQAIAAEVNTLRPGKACLIFNSQSWDRQELANLPITFMVGEAFNVSAADELGHPLVSQLVNITRHPDNSLSNAELLIRARVPSCGYQTVFIQPKPGDPDVLIQNEARMNSSAVSELPVHPKLAQATILENHFYRVEIQPSGALASIYDKVYDKHLLGSGGLELVFEEDLGCFCHIDPNGIVWRQSDFPPGKIEIIEHGPLRWRGIVENQAKGCSYKLEIILFDQNPQIEFRLFMDIRSGEDLRARVHFALPGTCKQIWAETPFGAISRQEGLAHAINWVDCQGEDWKLALLNQGLSNYEVQGNDLWLTLWRGLSLYADCAGCLPRDQRQPLIEHGLREFRFSLLPHDSDWQGNTHSQCQIVHAGLSFNNPLQPVLTGSHPGKLPSVQSWISITPSTVIASTVKIAEEGQALVIRLYESAGRQTQALLHLPHGIIQSWQEVNLLEESLTDSLLASQELEINFHPFEIKTLLLKRELNG